MRHRKTNRFFGDIWAARERLKGIAWPEFALLACCVLAYPTLETAGRRWLEAMYEEKAP